MEGTYTSLHDHDSKFNKKIISCSNEVCSVLIERCKLASHVRESCNYTEVYCKYASIGCEKKKLRSMRKTWNVTSQHLTR